jgi:ArsR family transcriptional regulator
MACSLEIFRALGDPTRLRIMALVGDMELSIGELADVLGQSQPRVSRHVKILADAGLLRRYKEGAWVFLRADDAGLPGTTLAALADMIAEAGDAGDRTRIAEIRARRVAEMQSYFERNADGWDGIRSLHVSDEAVEAAILAALDTRPCGDLLDIGTGTGRMIELLAPLARQATGVDRSPEMLRVARGKLAATRLGNCQVRLADMYELPVANGAADTVVVHQVLHYAEDPAAVIREAARVLAPGGRLLIVDFAPHDLEELRQRHAHVRLGFSDAAILGWMAAAGLDARTTDHLVGDRLTVGLWLGERTPHTARKAA